MLVTVEQRLMDIFFRVLTDLILLTWIQGTGYNIGCQNLFQTFFKEGEEGFGLDGLPTTVYNEGLSHRVLNGRLTTSTFILDSAWNGDYAVCQPLINCFADIYSVYTSIGG